MSGGTVGRGGTVVKRGRSLVGGGRGRRVLLLRRRHLLVPEKAEDLKVV